MSSLIAKRYVKALIKDRDLNNISMINDQIKFIATAYKNERFLDIINSIDVTTQSKVELLLSFIDGNNIVVNNLIGLLGKNRRLALIPSIADELNNQCGILHNQYDGVIYSNVELTSEYVMEIQNKFSNKFNVKLNLTNEVCDYDGIKVDIDGLGVEIGFEKDKFKCQMIEHILKAV